MVYVALQVLLCPSTIWESYSLVNLKAAGLLSLKSKGSQALNSTSIKGGAINIETDGSFNINKDVQLNSARNIFSNQESDKFLASDPQLQKIQEIFQFKQIILLYWIQKKLKFKVIIILS